MMYFRYKIKKDLILGGYTLTIQNKSNISDKWKRFKCVDMFKACMHLEDCFYFSYPSIKQQRVNIVNCIDKYGSVEKLVIEYILSILRERSDKMIEHNKNKDLKKLVNNIASNTWSDVIIINEDKISKETDDE